VCFLVTTEGAKDHEVHFTTSPQLTEHMDKRTVKVSIASVGVPQDDRDDELVTKIKRFEMSEIQGFPEFQKMEDLEVCFDTVPSGAGKRCVYFYFSVPPYHLRLSVDGENFTSAAVASVMPYQRTRVAVRVRDFNVQDRVCINYPQTYNSVSGVPNQAGTGLMVDQGRTPWFLWEDVGDDCYEATRCVSGSGRVNGELCIGGEGGAEWERVFFIKPKGADVDTTLDFGGVRESKFLGVSSQSRVTGAEDYAYEQTKLELRVIRSRPAFLDNVPGVNRVPGTPYSMQRFAPAFINCPVPRIAIYVMLQHWKNTTGGYLYEGSEGVSIEPFSALPDGIVLTYRQEPVLEKYQLRMYGNYLLEGSISTMEVDWTPTKGQEGRDYTFCFMARGVLSGSSNTRCFVVPVQRCQYCTLEGDSLHSLAVDFRTSWLQLWAANAGPSFESDDDESYPINPAHVNAGTRLSLGPVYHVKPHDSLDSLATRFHTSIEQLMDMNPDLVTEDIEVGQELCIIPDVCPKELVGGH
jgi:hypothetical protein